LNGHTAGLEYPQKQAKLASSLNVGINCEEDLPMTHRLIGHTLYLNEKTSVLQWQPRHMKRMIGELNAYRPVILEANPSLLARLAYWAIDNGAAVYSPRAIVFTFEFPSAIHLAAIGQVFTSALISSYGTTETGFVMEQCERGFMHQNTEFCRIDFEPLKPEFGGPELGRIFVTTFDNPWNIVLRFDVGDLVRLNADGACVCGRSEGMVAGEIEGRVGNATFTADGGLVATKALDDGVAAVGALRDYRLEQLNRNDYYFEAKLSPEANENAARGAILGVLKNIYGAGGNFDIRIAADIMPGPAGKYRRTQANFDFNEAGLFQ
jgi:phenylacetate-coenzyme A ligase PaaK-like adenylate-forming protein